MKYFALLLCIAIAVHAYDRDAAFNYAYRYWDTYNRNYHNYNSEGGDCANFVSQCLIAGGFNLVSLCGSGVAVGVGGTVISTSALGKCLKNSGSWTVSSTKPSNMAKGDVILYPGHSVFVVNGSPNIRVAAHNRDVWMGGVGSNPTYYHFNDGTSGSDCVRTCYSDRCVEDVARDVIRGKYGNGSTRKQKLRDEGCDVTLVQNTVNSMM